MLYIYIYISAYKISISKNGIIGSYLHGRKTPQLGLKGAIVSLETNEDISNLDYESDKYQSLLTLSNNIAIHMVNILCLNILNISYK